MVKIEMGDTEAASIKLWSLDVFTIFKEGFVGFFTAYDILWIILAVFAAWSIPKAIKLKK